MNRWLFTLFGLSALPPFSWMVWLIYLQITAGMPDRAGVAGMMGVMAGFLPFVGMQFAKLFWQTFANVKSPLRFHGLLLAICFELMTGLIAIMRFTGDFSERVYGDYVPLFSFGAAISVPAGVLAAVLMWFAESPRPSS